MIDQGNWRALNIAEACKGRQGDAAGVHRGLPGRGVPPNVQHYTVVTWLAEERGAVGDAPAGSAWSELPSWSSLEGFAPNEA